LKFYIDGEPFELDSSAAAVARSGDRLMVRTADGTSSAVAIRSGDDVLISYQGKQYRLQQRPVRKGVGTAVGNGELRAPMPGQIVDVLVSPGDVVRKGDKILVLEAMKTQQAFPAPFDGKVMSVTVAKGQQVTEGAVLAVIEANSA
jgi:biotin carboxyl carrier protein